MRNLFGGAMALLLFFTTVPVAHAWKAKDAQIYTDLQGLHSFRLRLALVGQQEDMASGYAWPPEQAKDYLNWIYHPAAESARGTAPEKIAQLMRSLADMRIKRDMSNFFRTYGTLCFYLSSVSNPLNTMSSPREKDFYDKFEGEVRKVLQPALIHRIGSSAEIPQGDPLSLPAPAEWIRLLALDASQDYAAVHHYYTGEFPPVMDTAGLPDKQPDVDELSARLYSRYVRAAARALEWAYFYPDDLLSRDTAAIVSEAMPLPAPPPPEAAVPQGPDISAILKEVEDASRAQGLYRLMVNDIISVNIWNWYNEEARVAPDGTVQLPFIGLLQVQGYTLPEIQIRVEELVREKVLRQWGMTGYVDYRPIITISLVKFNIDALKPKVESVPVVDEPRVLIVGEVVRPGRYPAWDIARLLAQAGGQTRVADMKNVILIRDTKKYGINFEDFLRGKNFGVNVSVKDGDFVVVPKKRTEIVWDLWSNFSRFFNIFFTMETKTIASPFRPDAPWR